LNDGLIKYLRPNGHTIARAVSIRFRRLGGRYMVEDEVWLEVELPNAAKGGYRKRRKNTLSYDEGINREVFHKRGHEVIGW